jgi:hypothetical protein
MDKRKWFSLLRGSALCLAAGLRLSAGNLPADTLWYNGNPNGADAYANYLGTSIEFSKFNVTGNSWGVNEVWSDDEFFSEGPAQETSMAWEIWSGLGSSPDLVASGSGTPAYTATTFTDFGQTVYMMEFTGLNVVLAPGTYWVGVYGTTTTPSDLVPFILATSGSGGVGTPTGNGGAFTSTNAGGPFSGPSTSPNYSEGVAGNADVPEPSPVISMMAGLLLIGVSRRWVRPRKSAR